jgi:hypothetical protein
MAGDILAKKSRVTSQRRLYHLLSQMNARMASKIMAEVGTLPAFSTPPGKGIFVTALPGSGSAIVMEDGGWGGGDGETTGVIPGKYFDAVRETVPTNLDTELLFPDADY